MSGESEYHPEIKRSPWGAWSTAGFGFLILVVFFVVQLLTVGGLAAVLAVMDPQSNGETFQALGTSGFALAVMTCVSAVVCTGCIVLSLTLRNTPSVRQHLALTPISLKTLIIWIGIGILLIQVGDRLNFLLDRPIVPDFMINTYKTARVMPLFWFALVVAAPVFEETFFRGFLFEGFRHSWMRVPGTILLTTFIWTVIHVQYDLYELSLVFTLGLFLGIARARTQSLYVPLAIHAVINLTATIQTMLEVHGM